MGFWDAVASAGPYANNLHLAADKITTLTPHHSIFIGQMLRKSTVKVSQFAIKCIAICNTFHIQ